MKGQWLRLNRQHFNSAYKVSRLLCCSIQLQQCAKVFCFQRFYFVSDFLIMNVLLKNICDHIYIVVNKPFLPD